jgi:dihydrofolate reductase
MPNLIYSMSVSLDGYVAGPHGEIDWSAPDDELHRFHNDRVRELGAQLCGRRLYETMLYWETAEQDPALGEPEREFAGLWRALTKVVVSRTLDRADGDWRLIRNGLADEVARLKTAAGDVGVGGAGLAASCFELGLVDEVELFVNPVVLGAGTPFFPAGIARTDFELLDTRTFGGRIVHLRYARIPSEGAAAG